MEFPKDKNTIILKNLPSNLIDEAIIVLKSRRTVREIEKIEKENHSKKLRENKLAKNKEKNYIVKDAEMIVSNYILRVEKKIESKKIKRINQRKLQIYSIGVTIAFILQACLFFLIK